MSERPYWSGWSFIKLGDRPDSGSALRHYQIRERRYRLQERVMSIILQSAPALAYGDQDQSVDDSIIQEILDKIEEKQAGYALKHSRNFFVQALDKGKRLGLWSINVPAPVCTVRRKPALFQPDTFAHLPQIRRIQSVLDTTLNDPQFYLADGSYLTRVTALKGLLSKEHHKQLRAGQLLLTAILYGGLLEEKAVYLLPGHINTIKLTEDFLWIDIMALVASPLETGETRSAEEKRKRLREEQVLLKRWFPDAITELLLLRWHQDKLGEFPKISKLSTAPDKYCSYLLRVFCTAAGVDSRDLCSASELIQRAVTSTALEIPAFLLNVAQGKHATRSLPADAWQRFYSRCRKAAVNLELEQPEAAVLLPELDHLSEESQCIERYDQHRLYKTMIRQLSPGKTAKKPSHSASIQVIERFLAAHQDQVAAPLFRLCQWAIAMYRNGSFTKARLATSTIPKYLGQLQDSIHHLGPLDPMQREADELLEIYQLMIDQTKTLQGKFYKVGRIKEFQHFLINNGYDQTLDLNDLVHGKAMASRVDANYISELEYRQSLLELTRVELINPRLQKMRRLMLILGYRCGLRRTEAWKLRLCDIHWTHYPVLMVVATRHKSVKSGNAIRQLPLQPLLPEEELAELRRWVESRRAEQGLTGFETDNTFLFCNEHSANSLVDEHQIFAVLHCVLRAVSGDKTLRYHHLRHSFANNLLMRSIGLTIPPWKRPDCQSVQNGRLENTSQDTLFGLPLATTSRKHLFQISALLGHGGPDISLLHYIHLCDLLLLHSLNARHERLLAIKTVCVIAGLNKENLNKTRSRHYPDFTLSQVARIKMRQALLKHSDPEISDIPAVAQQTLIDWPDAMVNSVLVNRPEEPSIALLQQIIQHYDCIDKDAVSWAGKIAFPEYAVQQWINAGQGLAQLKTGKGALRHCRPQWWGLQNKKSKQRLIEQHSTQPPRCMPRPHNQQDIEDSRQAVQGIQHLRQTNPNLASFGVEYYLNYSVASRSHLRMKAPHQAEKFIEFILATGFARTRIHCQLKPQTKAGAISINQQVTFWAKLLSINPAQITLTQPLRVRGSAHGTLSVILNQKSGKDQIQASYGFRYGIYMMGILMLAAGEVSLMDLAAIK